MNAPFRLYGAELSPYSVKVRSYLRFKGLEFEWLERTAARQEEFTRYAKLPLAPILVDADDSAMQDSTPIIEALEAQFPDPSIVPEDAGVAFVSALLEDYADEWLNKAMFHFRWSNSADQDSAAARLAAMLYGADAPEGAAETMKARMVGRLHHVGSSLETAPVIEASFARTIALLDAILAKRDFLFGARPALADFGLAGQLAQLLSDPTPGAMLKAQAPNLVRWIDRMENPRADGAFLTLAALGDSIAPLLRDEVAATYLVWMAANAKAVADDASNVSVEIAGGKFTQKPQRYAAKALAELRRKGAAAADAPGLAALLSETGCAAYLALSARDDEGDDDAGDEGDED